MDDNVLKNLIFIEDDDLDYEMYSSIVSSLYPNIKTIQYDHVPENLDKLYRKEETLILLDLSISGRDGLQVYFEKIRPLQFMTYVHSSSDNPSDWQKCIEFGIAAYFSKQTGNDNIKKQLQCIIGFYEMNLIKFGNPINGPEKYLTQIDDQKKLIEKLRVEVSNLRKNKN